MNSPAAGRTPLAESGLRRRILDLPSSEIREIAHAGMAIDGVIPLWFGESDTPTPAFICDAASAALCAGHTFYSANRGVPALRDALAGYYARRYGTRFGSERITVTASGMNAIMIAMQCLLEPGDNLVIPSPTWPNAAEAATIMGAAVRRVPLDFTSRGWCLELDRLFAACDGATRCIVINSPGNPTGWMASEKDQRAILDFCRRRGIWLIADEVYERIVFEHAAPSFATLADPEDRVLVLNSFSKAWCMTGWRLGWMVAPVSLGPVLDRMNEYNVASAATPVQYGGIAALTPPGEAFIAESVARYRANRDLACAALSAHGHVRFARPAGAFYLFIQVDGMTDSRAAAHRLLRTARVGVAPGTAFGREGQGWLRLCFAVKEATLRAALDRLLPNLA